MFRFAAGSLKVTLLTMTKLGTSESKAAAAAVESAGKHLHKRILQNISLKDHTLDQLAADDHPYARRHGSIRIHRSGSRSLVNPEFRVHTQGGSLKNALRSGRGPSGTNSHSWRVRLDPGRAPHAAHVVLGTRVMLPRDVLWSTADAPEVKKQMMKAIVKKLGKVLRTGAVLRQG